MLAEPSGVEAQHLAEWLGNQLLPEASECRAIFTAQLQARRPWWQSASSPPPPLSLVSQ